MKRMLFAFLLLISVLFIFEGCNSTPKDSSNILKITEEDEETIQEYLDAKYYISHFKQYNFISF